jgi:1,4-alpha-glucan branching enzyme
VDRDENPTQTIDAAAPDSQTIDRLLGGAHHDPHSILGAHPREDGTIVRVLRPHADEVHVVRVGGEDYPLVKVHDAGLFSGVVPGPPADYRLAVRYGDRVDIVDDPYRWLPTLGEMDLHLISEGRHERLWDVLGAHVRSYDTPSGMVTGTSFAVWAPTAQGVRVTGDFDGWSGWAHPMRVLGSTGVWELFVPGITPGVRYKYRILGADGRWRDKADPLAFRTEIPPATGSIVDVPTHEWADEQWMTTRAQSQAYAEPMSVYEVHLGSWRQGLNYREMAQQLVDYLDETGFTHVELLPVAEHPFGGSWGYQVTSYYAPTARFGTPDDFRWFVDHLHQHGYGVIVDWVPAHFPRDEWALAKFDGTPLYEHADPRRGEQPDWGTLVFDFGRREVRNFLVANAMYWLDQFHIDGLRVDAVASMLYLDYSRPEGQWLPNIHGGRENLDAVAFLQEMNATVYKYFPGVMTIAEESTAWPGVSRPTHLGGLGFGFKWNMGWMHDTLDYIGRDPIYRGYHHNQMTFSLMYAFSENFVLPLSHDEVVHGKGSLWQRMPGDAWNKAANLRALLAYMWAHPGKQLLFQGGEFGQEREWSEQRSLDWHLLEDPLHGGIKTLVGDLNRAYRSLPAMWTRDVSPEGFSWIDANDSGGNVLSFLRHGVDAEGKPTVMACVANFSGNPKPDYRVGLPFAGRWREVLNTDAASYGGSGVGNLGGVDAEQVVWHGRPASAVLQLPPAGVLWLAPEPFEGAVRRRSAAAVEPAAPAEESAADIGEPGAEATAPVAEPAAASADVIEPEESVVDFGRPSTGSTLDDAEPADEPTVGFDEPTAGSADETTVAESTVDIAEPTVDEDTLHVVDPADEPTASVPEPTVRIPTHAAEPEPAEESTVSIADLPSTATADEDATTRTFAPTSTSDAAPTSGGETTTRIPHPLSDEATTRFTPPDAADDTATPPNGIALLDDETLEAQSSASSDREVGQATGEVAGTAEAGSSDEPDDGPDDTAHRNSTAQ